MDQGGSDCLENSYGGVQICCCMIVLCLKSAKYSTSEAGELENMKELWDIPSHRSNSLSVIDLAGSDRVFTPSHVSYLL
jgi:hypothetical protein